MSTEITILKQVRALNPSITHLAISTPDRILAVPIMFASGDLAGTTLSTNEFNNCRTVEIGDTSELDGGLLMTDEGANPL